MFSYRSFKQKIILSILTFMTLFTFIAPNVSNAGVVETAGNYALDGLQAVCLMLGDSVVYFLHKFFYDSTEVEKNNAGQVKTEDNAGIKMAYFPLTPETIFKGKVESVDINFFSPISNNSIASQLRNTVSRGYVGLRYIAIVGLMLVLAYLGIKIMLESTAEAKAEYKKKLNSWLVAIFLVFFLHYIMVGSIALINKITNAINTSGIGENKIKLENLKLQDSSMQKRVRENYKKLFNKDLDGLNEYNGKDLYASNIMEYARMMAQFGSQTEQFGYIIVYLLMVYFLVKFLWLYMKRVIYMAFLTIIAPLAALTYPMEKSKSLTRWLKEYFNLLIVQPMNLLVYVVMMSTAVSLIKTNLLYTIITLAFIDNADRIIKKIFNIGETSVSNGFAKGAIAMALGGVFMNKLTNGNGNKDSGNKQSADKPKSYDRPNTSGDTTADMYGAFARGNGATNNNGENNQGRNKVPQVKNPQSNEGEYESHDNINDIQNDMENYDWGNDGKQNKSDDVPAGFQSKEEWDAYRKANGIEDDNNEGNNLSTKNKEEMENKFEIKPKKISKAKSGFGKATRLTLKNGGKLLATGGKIAVGAATGTAAAAAAGAIVLSGRAKGGPVEVAKAFGKGARTGYNAPSDMYRKTSEGIMKARYRNDPAGYKKAMDAKQAKLSDEAFLEDRTNEHKQVYIKEFGKNQYKEKMQEALEFRKHGITDDNLISKAMKEKDYNREEQIQLANIASRVKKEKDLQRVREGLKQSKVDEERIEQITNKIKDWKGYNNL